MKIVNLVVLIISSIILVAESSLIRKRNKRRARGTKKIYEPCYYQLVSSDCADGLTCSVMEFSYAKQALVYVDKVGHDTYKGICKYKPNGPCRIEEKESHAPCLYNYTCELYDWKGESKERGICKSLIGSLKEFTEKMEPKDIQIDAEWKKKGILV